MEWKRFFSTSGVKGTRQYLDTQKKYEIIRTVVYFAISLSLFAAGIVATGTRNNLLTIVAVLGCLPASKSLVEAIMYCRYHSLSADACSVIEAQTGQLSCLYDLVFTTREKTYPVLHMAVAGNTVIGYMPDSRLSGADCAKHLETCLKTDSYTGISIKLFGDLNKYADRLAQLSGLPADEKLTAGIENTLKSIAL